MNIFTCKIFILNGAPRSGKDTLADKIKEWIDNDGGCCEHFSSIGYYKTVLHSILKYDSNISIYNKDEKYRDTLVQLKKAIDDHYPDLNNQYIISQIIDWIAINTSVSEQKFVAFIDIREPENIKNFINICNKHNGTNSDRDKFILEPKTVYIDRPSNYTDITESDRLASDKNLYPYDIIVNNIGSLVDFYKEIYKFFNDNIKK